MRAPGLNLSCLICGWLLLAVVPAFAQSPAAPAAPLSPLANFPENHYTIAGEVAQPGTYTFPTHRVHLRELLRAAGGTTAAASGNVRLIRRGFVIDQTFVTPSSTYVVQNGDVLIVDPRNSGVHPAADIIGGSTATPVEQTAGAGSRTAPIPVVLLNVQERPVVLNLTPEQATVKGLDQLLRQEHNPARRGVLLMSGSSPISFEGESHSTLQLPSGTVVVYDPTSLDRGTLPSLKTPVFATSNSVNAAPGVGNFPLASGAATERGPALQEPPPYPGRPQVTIDTVSTDETRPVPVTQVTPEARKPPMDAGPAMVPPVPETEIEPLPLANDAAGVTPISQQVEAAAPPPPLSESPHAVRWRSTPAAPRQSMRHEPVRTSGKAGLFAVITFAVLGGGAVAFVIYKRREPGETPAPPANAVTVPRDNLLEALIRDQLPLLEEPVALPADLQFHGKPAEGWRYRVDARHNASNEPRDTAKSRPRASTPPAPHFKPVPESSPAVADAGEVEKTPVPRPIEKIAATAPRTPAPPEMTAAPVTASAPRRPASPARESEVEVPRLLERVLSAVQGGKQ